MARYCLTLDLIDDPALIAEYEAWHTRVWPEVLQSMRQSGIRSMDIYRWKNRLCMVMETHEAFCFDAKAAADAANPVVQEWETLMWKYQQALPGTSPGEKWQRMENIFAWKTDE